MQPSTNKLDPHIHAHSQRGIVGTHHKKLRRATLNSTECFQNYSFMLLKQVSLHLDCGKAKTAVETNNNNKKTMNSKSGVFQLKKLQLIWEVAEHISCFQFYLSKIFYPSLLYMPGLTHHGYTPKLSGTRVLDQCQSIYIFKNTLKMPALPQLGLLPPCPAVRVVNISNIHDVWTSSKWLTHTLTLLKNFSVCPPAVQVWRRDERFFSPEIKENWKQTILIEHVSFCQDHVCSILSPDLV